MEDPPPSSSDAPASNAGAPLPPASPREAGGRAREAAKGGEGSPIPIPTPASSGDSSTSSRTPSANTCINCAYSLAGLPVTGLCPECAAPIAASINHRRLELAPLSYLLALRRGVNTIRAAFFALSLLVIAIIAWEAFSPNGTPLELAIIFGAIAFVMFELGILNFTSTNPAEPNEPSDARDVLRLTAWLLLGITIFCTIRVIGVVTSASHFDELETGLGAWMVLAGCGLVVQLPSLLLYLSDLASRIPDAKLARDLSRATVTYTLTAVLGAVVLIGPVIVFIFIWINLEVFTAHLNVILRCHAEGSASRDPRR